MFVFKKYDRQNHVWSFMTKYLRFLCKFTSWSWETPTGIDLSLDLFNKKLILDYYFCLKSGPVFLFQIFINKYNIASFYHAVSVCFKLEYWHPHLPLGQYNSVFTLVMIKNYFIYITNYKDINIKIKTKKCPILFIINNKYFHGPSLHTYFKSPNLIITVTWQLGP
jgi:hypothetical protein